MNGRFEQLFDRDRFESDPPVHLWGVELYDATKDVWVAERLWHRLCSVAEGYDLHLLPLLRHPPAGNDHFALNAQQCAGLLDELGFVADLVKDPLLSAEIAKVTALVLRTSRAGAQLGVGFT